MGLLRRQRHHILGRRSNGKHKRQQIEDPDRAYSIVESACSVARLIKGQIEAYLISTKQK